MFLYQILTSATHQKIKKKHIKTVNVKYQVQDGMECVNY